MPSTSRLSINTLKLMNIAYLDITDFAYICESAPTGDKYKKQPLHTVASNNLLIAVHTHDEKGKPRIYLAPWTKDFMKRLRSAGFSLTEGVPFSNGEQPFNPVHRERLRDFLFNTVRPLEVHLHAGRDILSNHLKTARAWPTPGVM